MLFFDTICFHQVLVAKYLQDLQHFLQLVKSALFY